MRYGPVVLINLKVAMESVEIRGPVEVYLGDNITLECVTGESFPGK